MLNLDKKVIQNKGLLLFKQLKDYVKEENIIKTIKKRAEIMKANQEDGSILDKVCKILVLG